MDEYKRKITNKRCTVSTIKEDIRKQFRARLKELRHNSLSNVRNITSKVELLQLGEQLNIEGCVLSPDEIFALLEEVEHELQLSEEDQYINDTNAIIEELMMGANCPVCAKQIPQNTFNVIDNNKLCEQCINSFD